MLRTIARSIQPRLRYHSAIKVTSVNSQRGTATSGFGDHGDTPAPIDEDLLRKSNPVNTEFSDTAPASDDFGEIPTNNSTEINIDQPKFRGVRRLPNTVERLPGSGPIFSNPKEAETLRPILQRLIQRSNGQWHVSIDGLALERTWDFPRFKLAAVCMSIYHMAYREFSSSISLVVSGLGFMLSLFISSCGLILRHLHTHLLQSVGVMYQCI